MLTHLFTGKNLFFSFPRKWEWGIDLGISEIDKYALK